MTVREVDNLLCRVVIAVKFCLNKDISSYIIVIISERKTISIILFNHLINKNEFIKISKSWNQLGMNPLHPLHSGLKLALLVSDTYYNS